LNVEPIGELLGVNLIQRDTDPSIQVDRERRFREVAVTVVRPNGVDRDDRGSGGINTTGE
jgi:hypothetical protein